MIVTHQQPNSSSRSVSMSMDDSTNLQVLPIIQKMKAVNEQQLLVRKPIELSSEQRKAEQENQGKSPATTSLTPQQASDRMNFQIHNELKDLLLINEEPSNKEQSQQLAQPPLLEDENLEDHQRLQRNEQGSEKQLVIDEKLQSYSDVRWSRIASSRSNQTQNSCYQQQFEIIRDQGAEFENNNNFFSYIIKQVPTIKNTYIQLTYNILLSLFLLSYLTILNLEQQQNKNKNSRNYILQSIMFITILYDILSELSYKKYDNGISINKIIKLLQIYVQGRFIIDLLTLVPFIAYLIGYDNSIIYLFYNLRIFKIYNTLYQLSYLFDIDEICFYIYRIIEFHFIFSSIYTIYTVESNNYISIYQQGIMFLLNYSQSNNIYLYQVFCLFYLIYVFRLIIRYTSNNEFAELKLNIQQKQLIQEQLASQSIIKQPSLIGQLSNDIQQEIKQYQYLHILQSIPIFKTTFSVQTLKKIANTIQEYVLEPNQTIIQPKSRNQGLYFVIKGNVQIFQENDGMQFNLQVLNKEQSFNNQAFFLNQLSNIGAYCIGYCKVICIDLEQFNEILITTFVERQKYKMMLDQICLYHHYSLANIVCYACFRHHDIDECPNVHYVPNQKILISYINENEVVERGLCQRKIKKHYQRTKGNFLKNEEAVILFQQIHNDSDSNYEKYRYVSEYQPSINKQFTTPHSNPIPQEYEDNQPSNQAIAPQQEEGQSIVSIQQQAMELNISPVPYIQQPPSGFSHSSYGFLLKDASINNTHKKKIEGSDKDRGSSNMFSVPYSSSGTNKTANLKGSKNSDVMAEYKVPQQVQQQQSQQQDEQLSIHIKKPNKVQDSLFYHQKRLFYHRDYKSIDSQENHSSKYRKYYTGGVQQSQKSERSERKSNSLINEISESRLFQQQLKELQQQNNNNEEARQLSKYGIQSSKFTGETAKQFMRNPLEMPNMEFYQSFEKSNQFSDYFPLQNVDQAIESYKQYQASRGINKLNVTIVWNLFNKKVQFLIPISTPIVDATFLQSKSFVVSVLLLQQSIFKDYAKICGMDGVEAPLFSQQSIIAFYIITLIFTILVFYGVTNVKQTFVGYLNWILLLYIIGCISVAIVCIISLTTIDEATVTTSWNKLTQYRKTQRFDSQITNLVDKNKLNLVLVIIYIFFQVLIFLLIFYFNQSNKMPDDWRPPFSARLVEPQPLIYKAAIAQQQQDEIIEEGDEEEQEQESKRSPKVEERTIFNQGRKKTERFKKGASSVLKESNPPPEQEQLQQQQQPDQPF